MTVARLSEPALLDLRDAVFWISQDSPRAAAELREEIVRAAERLGEFPTSGERRPRWTDLPVRFLTLRRFPYILIYDPDSSPPEIIRVIHAARDVAAILNTLHAP